MKMKVAEKQGVREIKIIHPLRIHDTKLNGVKA